VPLRSAGAFLKETANVAAQFKDYITGSEAQGFDDIPVGEGAVLRHGLSKIAAFRDDRGKLHVHSAVCPHLACIVHWNSLEKVWDCPCHGSQFAPTGQVLHGPAVSPLKTVADFNNAGNPNID
jgi:Rieske Fe-S protein